MIIINPNPQISKYNIKVEPLGDWKYKISWNTNFYPNPKGFKIFAGFEPFYIRSLISGPNYLPNTTNTFEYQFPKNISPDVDIYFWVAAVTQNDELVFVDEWGINERDSKEYEIFTQDPHDNITKMYLIDDLKYFFEEIRRRALTIWKDICEEVILFKRQWHGLPDLTTQDELNDDPYYYGDTRQNSEYGIGFYPGFFPGILTKVRFGQLPNFTFDFQPSGLRPLMDINQAWTIWMPHIRKLDLIYRKLDGKFYVVKNAAYSNIRGIRIIQSLNIEPLNTTNPLNKLKHNDLVQKWSNINKIDFLRIGFGVMPSNSDKVEDYLLFRF